MTPGPSIRDHESGVSEVHLLDAGTPATENDR